jgi:hypothetical protein
MGEGEKRTLYNFFIPIENTSKQEIEKARREINSKNIT